MRKKWALNGPEGRVCRRVSGRAFQSERKDLKTKRGAEELDRLEFEFCAV